MGRRKWAHYQDVLNIPVNTTTAERPAEPQEPTRDSQSDVQESTTVSINGRTGGFTSPSCSKSNSSEDGASQADKKESAVNEEATENSYEDQGPPLNHCRLPQTPVDWNPEEKCYICDDGKLLAVDDRGESVSEIGSGKTEPHLAETTPLDSDSDSSGNECELNNSNGLASKPHQGADRPQKHQSKMTSLESVVAAVASMHGIPSVSGLSSLYPGLWYPFGNLQVDGGESNASANGKMAIANSGNCEDPPSGGGGGGDQPLDLSAKSTSTSGLDQKNIFKAKPRMTTISGRRTYTEDELQNALQDILSGKLGTRRAAVLYGIPRSTLRNKVYKLAIEQKREANLAAVTPVLADLDDDDKDCSGAEEEKDVERTLSSLPSDDIFRLAAAQGLAAFGKFGKMEDNSSHLESEPQLSMNVPQMSPTSSKPQTPVLPMNMMDPNIILQGLLIGGALSGLAGNKAVENTNLGMLPEFLRNILLHNELLKGSEGGPSKSVTPETSSVCSTGRSGSEHNENLNMDDLHLKAQSFKSINAPDVPSTSPLPLPTGHVSFLSKNGGDRCGLRNSAQTPPSANSSHQPNILGSHEHPRDCGSPPLSGIGSVSLRDVIAKSISKTMQPPTQLDKRDSMEVTAHQMGQSIMEHYKWPAISVKKGLGAEVNRFGGMSASGQNMLSNNASLNNQLNNSTGTGGKGTRPKRGKYRNYDRDSLVEAVKAVQRGEMSVHRAGSYYGVPHSTLEYKVKERHLMRPRKREPKPQPQDERNSSCGPAPGTLKVNEITSVIRNPMDKAKNIPVTAKSPLKASTFDATSPNGIKGPSFLDSATMAAQLQYSPHMFWPHPPNFPGMTLDFSRAAVAAAAAAVGPSASSSFQTSESIFAAQMRQRFQDHAANSEAGNSGGSNGSGSGSSSANNSKSTTPNSAAPSNNNNNKMKGTSKTGRDFAESLYDGTSANGLLDGIIRHSLDRKSTDLHHGTLLDQLKNNLQLGKVQEGNGDISRKRGPSSPLGYGLGYGVKKERVSPDAEQMVNEIVMKRAAMAGSDRNASDFSGSDGTHNTSDKEMGARNSVDVKPKHAIVPSLEHDDNEDSS